MLNLFVLQDIDVKFGILIFGFIPRIGQTPGAITLGGIRYTH